MADLAVLKAANSARWLKMMVNPMLRPQFDKVAKRLLSQKAQAAYAEVEAITGVPRNVIAVIHERESGQDWKSNIAQGDPWNAVSKHVPKGRGPFKSWKDAACDALVTCAPYAARWRDWSPGGMMTLLEQYNGLGYANKGRPSPYIWAGTDQYTSGKYVADGKYDPAAIDHQLGCAGLLSRMNELSGNVPAIPPSDTAPHPPVVPAVSIQAKTGGAVAAGAAAGAAAQQAGMNWLAIIGVGAAIAVIAFIIIHFMKRKSDA